MEEHRGPEVEWDCGLTAGIPGDRVHAQSTDEQAVLMEGDRRQEAATHGHITTAFSSEDQQELVNIELFVPQVGSL